jgi:hypothetical protein
MTIISIIAGLSSLILLVVLCILMKQKTPETVMLPQTQLYDVNVNGTWYHDTDLRELSFPEYQCTKLGF